jgi:hypothetical protein
MKAIVEDLDEIPEGLRSEYEERDGKYVLKLEGELPGFVQANDYRELKHKVSKFRDGYTSVMKRAKEIAGVEEMGEDLAPLQSTLETLKDKLSQLSADPDSQTLQQQIQKAIKPLQEKLDRSEAERVAAQERANRATLRENIGTALTKAGARQNALGFLLDHSEKVFEVKDDKVVARDGNFDENAQPLTPGQWVAQAVKEYDFAFESSNGGGANPTHPGGAPIPAGAKILRNPTPEQLGQHMDDIASGKMQIVND